MYLSRRSSKRKTAKWHHRLLCNKNVDFRIERICRFKLISISFSKVSLSETWQSSFRLELRFLVYSFDVGLRRVLNIQSHEHFTWLKHEKRNGLFNGYWTWKSVCPNLSEKRGLCLNILHWESLLAVFIALTLQLTYFCRAVCGLSSSYGLHNMIWLLDLTEDLQVNSGIVVCETQTKQQDLMMWVCSHYLPLYVGPHVDSCYLN